MSEPPQMNRVLREREIADLPWEKKRAQHKAKKMALASRISGIFWKSEARKVCEERLKHYESTGNENKAGIYRMKLGI